jgi:histidine triad (HIT) family protein
MVDSTLDPNCEFCKIIMGMAKAQVVCETDATLAFFPLSPAVVGHTLVIPKVHVADLWSANEALAAELMHAVLRVGKAIRSALKPEGMNLITSAGDAAFQTVYHLHLHLVPRWHNDRIGNIWPPKQKMAEEIKDEVAELIRTACRDQR